MLAYAQFSIIMGSAAVIMIATFLYTMNVAFAEPAGMTVTACNFEIAGCSVTELNNNNDVSGGELDKGDFGIAKMSDSGQSGDINSVTVYIRHMGDAGISDYIQDDCADEATGPGLWDKVGTTNYCDCPVNSVPNTEGWTTHACIPIGCDWTWEKLADLEVRMCNDDGSGPSSAYIDYINVTVDYSAAVGDSCDTCDMDCSEYCTTDSDLDCGGSQLRFQNAGMVTIKHSITNWNYFNTTNANGCYLNLTGGGYINLSST